VCGGGGEESGSSEGEEQPEGKGKGKADGHHKSGGRHHSRSSRSTGGAEGGEKKKGHRRRREGVDSRAVSGAGTRSGHSHSNREERRVRISDPPSTTAAPPPPPSSASGRRKGGQTAGVGKGKATGKGLFGIKRRKDIKPAVDTALTKSAIRRLARRGGVKRIGPIYADVRGVTKEFLTNVVRDACVFTEHAHRKTVTSMDVIYALKRQGRTLYGFGG